MNTNGSHEHQVPMGAKEPRLREIENNLIKMNGAPGMETMIKNVLHIAICNLLIPSIFVIIEKHF